MFGSAQASWKGEAVVENEITPITERMVKIIKYSYDFMKIVLKVYAAELIVNRTTVFKSHEKISYAYDNDGDRPSSDIKLTGTVGNVFFKSAINPAHASRNSICHNAMGNGIHCKIQFCCCVWFSHHFCSFYGAGIFLTELEEKHPHSNHEPDTIHISDFNVSQYDKKFNWVQLTDHEYDTNHRVSVDTCFFCMVPFVLFLNFILFFVPRATWATKTQTLPVGLYCFLTHTAFTALNVGHGPGTASSPDPTYLQLEHCQIARSVIHAKKITCNNELYTTELNACKLKRNNAKMHSECYLEILSDDNTYHDARLIKAGGTPMDAIDSTTGGAATGTIKNRQYIAWSTEHGREQEHFKTTKKKGGTSSAAVDEKNENDRSWTYKQDVHGKIPPSRCLCDSLVYLLLFIHLFLFLLSFL